MARYGAYQKTQSIPADKDTEAHLGTHDVALSIPDTLSERHHTFRLILLSAEDTEAPGFPSTLTRIQQLHDSSTGHNAAVVFLLDQDTAQPAMHPFMDLHIQYTITTHFRTPHTTR
ncbi:hypothetical protein BT67DRAFT_439419 [Trichocladium antarcticum]|uniref:Uncharacterized protein n=1 Tax=Trichocladium antarcticum TaxID=1450529 RepID=A0AAN6UPC4_9PEZI|nr:hypothetical protein BT67DRAFT_439419 [Trichocladium antarcticum]